MKAGAFQWASKYGICLLIPDTSPRDVNCEGDRESWDFGEGAGFYLNATSPLYSKHYNMYSYIEEELSNAIKQIDSIANQIDFEKISIFGHSMGGHGALLLGILNPSKYKSISAFAPITNASKSLLSRKAFSKYLLSEEEYKQWDVTEQLKAALSSSSFIKIPPILVDQGSRDNFLLDGSINHNEFLTTCNDHENKVSLEYNLREEYDHSYYFVSTFVEDHLKFHLKHLLNS